MKNELYIKKNLYIYIYDILFQSIINLFLKIRFNVSLNNIKI